eukprot:9466893-Pyramimonas_sp.AAC.1
MFEATSIARVKRTLQMRPAETEEGCLDVGDQVEIQRPPSTKDAPGWAGPRATLSVDLASGR